MKPIISILFILITTNLYSQDTAKISQIDQWVRDINTSTLPEKKDSLVQDYSQYGYKMTTHFSLMINNGQLLRCVVNSNGSNTQNGITKPITAANTFYFRNNKLIKVEEHEVKIDEKTDADWYYWYNTFLHTTYQAEKSPKISERANILLMMSEAFVQMAFKK